MVQRYDELVAGLRTQVGTCNVMEENTKFLKTNYHNL